MSRDKKELLLEKVRLYEEKIKLKESLPHLYGFKWYPWAREFYESTNKINLLCAANQISKSSTQIRKCINWATNSELWPSLWQNKPTQFWYFYPSQEIVSNEFETKWKQFMPKNENDLKYGYKIKKEGGMPVGIYFNSGINLYFRTYTQKAAVLQSGTVDAIFCDEELPMELYDELLFRLSASNGYFHMVFTATLGQDFWRKTLEPRQGEEENLPDAFKLNVSMYDCMHYEDGSPSHWTEEKIAIVKARCKNHNEVLRRIFGRFVFDDGGKKYPAFDISRHMKKPHPLPKDWLVYVGADPGSGGQKGHAAALCYVAVRPDYKQGRVFLGWRGDGVITDNSYLVKKHIELKKQYKIKPTAQFYDWASKDFYIVASGMDESFIPAEKSHEVGEDIINTLFKNDMLLIYETDELPKLATELATLSLGTAKKNAKDNFADAFRYAITKVPWDFSGIGKEPSKEKDLEMPEVKLSPMQREIMERRKGFMDKGDANEWDDPDKEIDEWNELSGY